MLALLLTGCTDVNQTNSFVDQPTSDTVQASDAAETPEETQPPRATLYEQPTFTPEAMAVPTPSPETTPEEPSGFNG
jgi:hypothetical protein